MPIFACCPSAKADEGGKAAPDPVSRPYPHAYLDKFTESHDLSQFKRLTRVCLLLLNDCYQGAV
eukprot:scaffold74401_cov18-Prasinocladus_malaysianus.AAC.1